MDDDYQALLELRFTSWSGFTAPPIAIMVTPAWAREEPQAESKPDLRLVRDEPAV